MCACVCVCVCAWLRKCYLHSLQSTKLTCLKLCTAIVYCFYNARPTSMNYVRCVLVESTTFSASPLVANNSVWDSYLTHPLQSESQQSNTNGRQQDHYTEPYHHHNYPDGPLPHPPILVRAYLMGPSSQSSSRK